jgi:hypothetical protein
MCPSGSAHITCPTWVLIAVNGLIFLVEAGMDESQLAATVASRILGGEIPGNIKTPPFELGTPVYDWRELQHWRISEARLPPGAS